MEVVVVVGEEGNRIIVGIKVNVGNDALSARIDDQIDVARISRRTRESVLATIVHHQQGIKQTTEEDGITSRACY